MRFLLLFISSLFSCCFFFFFNDTATTEIYTLSLHDALPITLSRPNAVRSTLRAAIPAPIASTASPAIQPRSEEHTSELQSRLHLVCRLLLEKKKKITLKLHLAENTKHNITQR